MTTPRPSAERLVEIRSFFVGGEGWVMKAVADLLAELDAVTRERDNLRLASDKDAADYLTALRELAAAREMARERNEWEERAIQLSRELEEARRDLEIQRDHVTRLATNYPFEQ